MLLMPHIKVKPMPATGSYDICSVVISDPCSFLEWVFIISGGMTAADRSIRVLFFFCRKPHRNLPCNELRYSSLHCLPLSGRCWIFSCLNVMRLPFMKKFNLEEFEFSQSYLFFWDKVMQGLGAAAKEMCFTFQILAMPKLFSN